MALILDTGPLVAALNRRDNHHGPCRELIGGAAERLVIPGPVMIEVEYFLRRDSLDRAWRQLVDDVREGRYKLDPLTVTDYLRASELVTRYADLPLGFVDASVVALAERLGETKVASLDHRDLGVVRPRHCERLQLLP